MSETAEEIIQLRDRERDKQATFRSLWQDTADYIFPREGQITTTQTPGASRLDKIYDTTAIRDSQDMASGLSAALIPAGQQFFGLVTSDDELMKIDHISRYLSEATERQHREMFQSNFMLQFNETLRSDTVFGTCNLFSEWDASRGMLNFKDYDISMYQILEDNHGRVDTMILSFIMTARQAIQQFGTVSDDIRKASEDIKKRNDAFEFIHIVRPRKDRNPRLRDNLNMPFESMFIDVKGKDIMETGGFEEFPFAVARWMKSSFEVYGRGQGTEVLADVKILQAMVKDLIECANKHNDPPLEVLESLEGGVRVTPGAINYVQQFPSIRAIDRGVLGNFPITREIIELQQEKIHRAFFRNIFVPLTDLTGDRRTTVEIIERVREGLRQLASPVQRLQEELLDPVITRTFRLLVRNGKIPFPPSELQGADFKIEYIGELGLALRNQFAKSFQQFAGVIMQLTEVFPDAVDVLNMDEALPDIAKAFGVKTAHISSQEEIAAKRQARQQQQAALQAAQMAEQTAGAYKDASGAPEEGSPAEKVMAGMGT